MTAASAGGTGTEDTVRLLPLRAAGFRQVEKGLVLKTVTMSSAEE